MNKLKCNCYFYHEEQDMGASIPTCNYYFKLGYRPCKNCEKYVDKSEVYRLVKYYADARAEMNKKDLVFSAIRKICKHYSLSRDMYGNNGQWEDACHHPEVVSSGASWGKCSMDTCPLYKERKTDEQT